MGDEASQQEHIFAEKRDNGNQSILSTCKVESIGKKKDFEGSKNDDCLVF